MELDENYDISTSALQEQRSASELIQHIKGISITENPKQLIGEN